MRNWVTEVLVYVFLLLMATGCHTFFEEDISDKVVELSSPTPGTETEIVNQTFWWQKIDGATDYRLQIVTPSFDASQELILDTLISNDKYSLVLFPSVFEWRVRAENSVYQTKWSNGTLTILSTADLTRQSVNLLSPGTITNLRKIRFEWSYLYNADSYLFVVYKEVWDGNIEVSPLIVDTTFLEKEITEGKFLWGVKAKNPTSETIYAVKNLTVDLTPPDTAILVLPQNDSRTSSLTISFTWTSFDLTSGILHDSLKVYSDNSLTKLVKSVISSNNMAELTFPDKLAYYWTVRSVDNAGNAGSTSRPYSFTIN